MKRKIDIIALIILILSAVNAGLIGLFDLNVILWLFGTQNGIIIRAIYFIVAIAGLWCINLIFVQRKRYIRNGDHEKSNGTNMVKREKQGRFKGNTIPNSMRTSHRGSLKDNPDGETICSPYFSNGCINEDTDTSELSQEDSGNETY